VATTRSRKAQRQAVLVMGMHRSGTSALSGILSKLGAQHPRTLLPPNDANPRGYFESHKLMVFHDQLLRAAGSSWSDCDSFDPDWMDSAAAETFRARVPELIAQEFGEARLLLIKDPRISRFPRFWLDSLARLSITPKVIICVRHPGEVAQSLEARNEFGRTRSQLLWLRHMLDAEIATRGIERSFVHYDMLLQDWPAQVRKIAKDLRVRWPRRYSDVATEIEHFLTSSLRHSRAGGSSNEDHSELDGWVRTSYGAFAQLAADGKPEDGALAKLDVARNSFDQATTVFRSELRRLRHERDQLRTAMESALDERFREIAGLSRFLLDEESTSHKLRARLEEREGALGALLEQHEKAMVAIKHELSTLRQEHESAAKKARAAAEDRLQALRAEHAVHVSSLENARQSKQDELEELRERMHKALAARDARFDHIRRKHAQELAAAKQSSTRQREASDEKIARREATLKSMSCELQLHRAHLREVSRRLLAIETSRSWRWTAWLRGGRDTSPTRLDGGLPLLEQARLIRESGSFDAAWYLAENEDVVACGADPVLHYLQFGADEGRDPAPDFSTRDYVRDNPGLTDSGMNPLFHSVIVRQSRCDGDDEKAALRSGGAR
jgi:hypothetical protein